MSTKHNAASAAEETAVAELRAAEQHHRELARQARGIRRQLAAIEDAIAAERRAAGLERRQPDTGNRELDIAALEAELAALGPQIEGAELGVTYAQNTIRSLFAEHPELRQARREQAEATSAQQAADAAVLVDVVQRMRQRERQLLREWRQAMTGAGDNSTDAYIDDVPHVDGRIPGHAPSQAFEIHVPTLNYRRLGGERAYDRLQLLGDLAAQLDGETFLPPAVAPADVVLAAGWYVDTLGTQSAWCADSYDLEHAEPGIFQPDDYGLARWRFDRPATAEELDDRAILRGAALLDDGPEPVSAATTQALSAAALPIPAEEALLAERARRKASPPDGMVNLMGGLGG